MRWLLLKDLQILRRSPFLVALLILYPVTISLLVGAAVSGTPSKPKVAVAYLVPPDKDAFTVGGLRLKGSKYIDQLVSTLDAKRVKTKQEALDLVDSGKAVAALIIPPDATERLQSTLQLGAGNPVVVDIYYNAENAAKRRGTEQAIRTRLADANLALSEEITNTAANYLKVITTGGSVSLLGQTIAVLGLRNARQIIDGTIASLPKDAPEKVALAQVSRFAQLAADNLDISKPILASIGSPIHVKERVLKGSQSSLQVFFAQIAVTISLMFVTLLLTAGMLALEREENAYSRLVRGLVHRRTLLAEKITLGAVCGVPLVLIMLAILSFFLSLDQARAWLWVPAALFAALGFSAMGVAIGALARDVRAASLLAFGLALPIAALAMVPTGSVSDVLYKVISAVNAIFPFKPSLQAFDAAVAGGGLLGPVLHLAALTLGFAVVARLALRRYG